MATKKRLLKITISTGRKPSRHPVGGKRPPSGSVKSLGSFAGGKMRDRGKC